MKVNKQITCNLMIITHENKQITQNLMTVTHEDKLNTHTCVSGHSLFLRSSAT